MSRIKILIVYAAYLLYRCVDKVKSIGLRDDTTRILERIRAFDSVSGCAN